MIILLIAIGSDFLDGLAANHFHAKTAFGAVADPIADCMLAAACITGLYLNGYATTWALIIMALSAVAIGCVKFLPTLPGSSPAARSSVQKLSVAYLFIVWIGSAWAYASLAYGWSWLYPATTVILLASAATFKRHRITEWYG